MPRTALRPTVKLVAPAGVSGQESPKWPISAFRLTSRSSALFFTVEPSGSSGQSLVEFALVLPLIFLLILNAVNFGGFLFAWITVANAARAGADYMTMSTASVGKPAAPTAAQVTTLVTNDISSLMNRASLVVRVCTNNNGAIGCTGSGSQTPPADPEPSNYVLGSVDVTYTYQPFLSAWNFSRLGIHLTLPATTIHRRAVMRILQ